MKRLLVLLSFCLLFFRALPSRAQDGESYHDLLTPRVRSGKLSGPERLRDYVVDGKLRLSLRDAVILNLENNTSVRIDETQVESAKFLLLGAHGPFDPTLTSSYNVNSSSAPPFTALQGTEGAPTVKSTTQFAQVNYTQTFQTGTNIMAGLSANNFFVNNANNFFNPYVTSALNFQFTQPLLKNGWLFANRAPLVIARRSLQQSRANFAVEVSNSIQLAVNRYWSVVEARGNLEVGRRSLEAAEASYKHDKRALELGALPPLEIYRSESRVASRRVLVIQNEYEVKQAEDVLRRTIGASQDDYFRALDLELTEKAEPDGELRTIDAATALQQALLKRPEFDAARAALANDETSLRLAHNHLLPQLDLTASYASNGLGGTQFNGAGQRVTSSSLNQLFGFDYPTYVAQLSLTLPLRNRGAQAEMGNALVSRRNDLYRERQTREQVVLEVSNAVHQLEQAKISMAAGREAVELARKEVAAEQRKYELDRGPVLFVLDAQTGLADAEQSLLQAEVRYQNAVTAVDYATGGILEPYHVQISELTK